MSEKLIIAIGPRITVEIEGSATEAIKKAAFWNALPTECPICKAEVGFSYRNPKGFHYYGLRCTGPTPHETTFGQFQEAGKGLYYKERTPWEVAQRGHDDSFEKREHDRLDDEIRAAWARARPNKDLDEAIRARYDNKVLANLSIEEKQHIYDSLTAI